MMVLWHGGHVFIMFFMQSSPSDAGLIADTHVHLYRCYDIGTTLRRAYENLMGLARILSLPNPVPVLCLTERHDHHVFGGLKTGRLRLDPDRVTAVPGEPAGLILQAGDNAPSLILLAGRQIITREKIEVLGLAMASLVSDGLSLEETVARVREQGGIPVLSWAPGKWFFGRGRIVRTFVSRVAPGEILLGDTSLRPRGWREPRIMRVGRRRGLGVVAGSDPLPFVADALWAGRVATAYRPAPFDWNHPVAEITHRLLREVPLQRRIGVRLSPAQVLVRLLHNRKAAKLDKNLGVG
jgi:hypothetical protein